MPKSPQSEPISLKTESPADQSSLQFSSSDPKTTGLRLISVTDSATNFTVRTALASTQRQVPSIMAFAGARFSRSAATAEDIFTEINVSKSSAQEKLANIFVNYGHASVGDMANLFLYIENIPRYLMMRFFCSTALGGGQARSSRFQNFSRATYAPIDHYLPTGLPAAQKSRIHKEFDRLFHELISHYTDFLPKVQELYTKIYQPDADNKRQASAMQARVFDTVRLFLPLATTTSGAYVNSAREWARLVQVFASMPNPLAQKLADQIRALLAPSQEIQAQLNYVPEAPDLIRHTEADEREQHMLSQLSQFARKTKLRSSHETSPAGEQVQRVQFLTKLPTGTAPLFFALLHEFPLLTERQFTSWYGKLSTADLRELSTLLFADFNHHHHLPSYFHTDTFTAEITATISELIDFNRHRAWGRFTPFLESENFEELFSTGFILPHYLKHEKAKKLESSILSALNKYYHSLSKFAKILPNETRSELLKSLLPNAHAIRYYLSGGAKEISYLTNLRVRPGGHINYRALAYDLAKEASTLSPIFTALKFAKNQKPDPFSREQFFDRG